MEISKDMLIAELLKSDKKDQYVEILLSVGMHCLGCAIAHEETIEEAAAVHGLDADVLIDMLNKA